MNLNAFPEVLCEVRGAGAARVGCITLNRAKALNALSLPMIRAITSALLAWRADAAVGAVVIRGSGKEPSDPHFGHFCAGGDIRFFHAAALSGDPTLEDFFTDEYALNHLIHTYPKPYIALMDGVVMGGGMGISQGAKLRVVTERTKMAMPETNIGLFPDVGGGYFLSRCPGRIGEYLALTGDVLGGEHLPIDAAIAVGLADVRVQSAELGAIWASLSSTAFATGADVLQLFASKNVATSVQQTPASYGFDSNIDDFFALNSVQSIVASLEIRSDDWSQRVAAALRARSPLMLEVTLEQIRRARSMGLADDLRMERDLVRHCFDTRHLQRRGAATETAEGVRALAVDKDHAPKWSPARLEDVTRDMVDAFFVSPWPAFSHPLRDLHDSPGSAPAAIG
jgi:enoyl-CoA hydratase/carnithine racemase